VARNTGVREARADLVALLDDDVFVPPGWLDALVEGAERYPDAEAFGGPIRPRLEGNPPRGCGREDPPITALDLGPEDREAEMVWGANFAVRRSAWERIGGFDETRGRLHGDEEDWLLRLRAEGGKIMYLAGAGLDHRRAPEDSRLTALTRAAFGRGRGARETDTRAGTAPGLARELRILVGCGWHTVRRACPQGIVMGGHAAGRLVEGLVGRRASGGPARGGPCGGPAANGPAGGGPAGGGRAAARPGPDRLAGPDRAAGPGTDHARDPDLPSR
jgi:Glycosyl transferase family 2